jgi:hypothetical protein
VDNFRYMKFIQLSTHPIRVDAVEDHNHDAEQISTERIRLLKHYRKNPAYGGAVRTYVMFRLCRKL